MKAYNYFVDSIKEDFYELPVQDQRIVMKRMEAIIRMKSKSESKDKETHLSYTIVCAAYLYMLETNKSSRECLDYVADKYMKDIEMLLSEKSRNSGKLSRKVVKHHDNHEVQKDMIKRNKFNRQALVNSKNVWQLLNTLSMFRQAYHDLITMEREINKLKDENRNIKLDLANAKSDIKQLQQVTGIEEMQPKEKARYLKELGYTQKDIADVIEKSLSTVKRWWDTL